MKVLLLSQYYPPEVGATQTRVHHFARYLSAAGHDVTVIAEVPNHPAGIILEEFRGKVYDRRDEDGLDVLRVWVATAAQKSFWRRIAFYATYAGNATLAALLLLRRRPDVIVASSPPLPVLLTARTLSFLWNRPYVADIRDIWPAIGVALGELAGGRTISSAQALERALYRRAAAVTVVTKGFVEHVIFHGADPSKVHHVPNGTLPEVFSPEHTEPNPRERLGLGDAFLVGYVGNHGIAQGLPAVLHAARRLKDTATRFLFVGEGPVKQDLMARCDRLGVRNVVFHAEVPMERVATFINACDVMLVPLRKLALLDTFIPSKMFDYMACGKPVILMADGEARAVLEDAGGGFVVEPENSDALATLIREIQEDPAALAAAGKAGREFVLARYSRHEQAGRLERILHEVAARRGP